MKISRVLKRRGRLSVNRKKCKRSGVDGCILEFLEYQINNPTQLYKDEKGQAQYFKKSTDAYTLILENGILSLKVCFPKLFASHNLYYVRVSNVKTICERKLKKEIAELGFGVDFSKAITKKIEFGFNILDSDSEVDELGIKLTAVALGGGNKVYSLLRDPLLIKDEEFQSVAKTHGNLAWAFYNKAAELYKKCGVLIDCNLTRVELKYKKKKLIKEFETDIFFEVLEKIEKNFHEKISDALEGIEERREKQKESMVDFIVKFKTAKKYNNGLLKELKEKFKLFDTGDLIEVLSKNKKALNGNYSKYKNQLLKEKSFIETTVFFKMMITFLNELAHVNNVKITWDIVPVKMLEPNVNIGAECFVVVMKFIKKLHISNYGEPHPKGVVECR